MLRKESEVVSEGNGPIPQRDEFGSDQPTMVDALRKIEEALEVCHRRFDKMEEYVDDLRSIGRRVASQEQDARQPRLAMEADGSANTKTRERTEGAAVAAQAMHGDSFSACRVDPDPKSNSTSFGMKAEPPAFPCRDDVVVESDDAAPKSCLPSLDMCTTTAADGLLPSGKTSTTTETNSNEPLPQFYLAEEANCKRTSTPYVSYDSSVWNLLAASSCRKVIETKSGENRTFDPGGSQGRLRACPFLGSWRALLWAEVIRAGAAG